MKTAMQELIELIENGEIRLDLIENHKQIWLEKEKMQIMNNYRAGFNGGILYCDGEAFYSKEEYYNQKYNQNES